MFENLGISTPGDREFFKILEFYHRGFLGIEIFS